jgi:NitT/TauT family transport system substrate-binding protein
MRSVLSRREVLRRGSLAGAALLVAACGGTPTSEQAGSGRPSTAVATPKTITKVTLLESGSGSMGWAANYVALEAGYFADEGLDVDYQYATVQAAVAAVVAGSAFLTFSGAPTILSPIAKGSPVRIVSVAAAEYTSLFVGTPTFLSQRGITSTSSLAERMKALRGAKIGINSPGDSSDQVLRFLLKRYTDFNPESDLTIVPLKDAAGQLAAIARGAVDVVIQSPPTPQQAEAQGLGRVFIRPQEVPEMKGYPYLVVSANQSELQNRLPIVTAAVKAIAKGTQLLRQDSAKAKPFVRKRLSGFAQDAFDLAYEEMRATLPSTPVLTKNQFTTISNFNAALGTPLGLSYEQSVDSRPAEHAVRDLGIKP